MIYLISAGHDFNAMETEYARSHHRSMLQIEEMVRNQMQLAQGCYVRIPASNSLKYIMKNKRTDVNVLRASVHLRDCILYTSRLPLYVVTIATMKAKLCSHKYCIFVDRS